MRTRIFAVLLMLSGLIAFPSDASTTEVRTGPFMAGGHCYQFNMWWEEWERDPDRISWEKIHKHCREDEKARNGELSLLHAGAYVLNSDVNARAESGKFMSYVWDVVESSVTQTVHADIHFSEVVSAANNYLCSTFGDSPWRCQPVPATGWTLSLKSTIGPHRPCVLMIAVVAAPIVWEPGVTPASLGVSYATARIQDVTLTFEI